MVLNILRQEALDMLRKDIPQNLEQYSKVQDPWVDSYFQQKGVAHPLISMDDIEIPDDIQLIPGDDAEKDIENAILLYEGLKGKLLPAQATDRRLWAALTHTYFYPYMHSRWPVDGLLNDHNTNGTVTDRYFKGRGVFRNGISRLYWICELSYDESLEDPYDYTRVFMSTQDLINQIDGSAPCRNKTVLKSCLKVFKNAGPLREDQTRQFFEILAKRAGVMVLDSLPPDTMETECQKILEFVIDSKKITDNCKLRLRPLDSNRPAITIDVRKGKAYNNKTMFRTKPANLYRLRIGKEIELGKVKYVITDILDGNSPS